eukprot:c40660_g1_i1.p1 GENE.c40660_g1_i1~~c40660_g1_i1.p1  ORF type:complete len:445 (+),score=64.66 c40660_g1_i1:120-1337(+)
MIEPVMIPACGHSFCKRCIDLIIKTNPVKVCPCCRARIQGGHLPPNFSLKGIIETFEIRCHNHIHGCKHTALVTSISSHHPKCLFEACTCSHQGCPLSTNLEQQKWDSETLLLKKDKAHHESTCEWRTVTCTNAGCNAAFPAHQEQEHTKTCEHFVIRCTEGCSERHARRLMAHHLSNTCRLVQINCKIAGCTYKAARGAEEGWNRHMTESVGAHSKHLANTVEALQRDNQSHLARIAALESMVRLNAPAVRWGIPQFSIARANSQTIASDPLCFVQAVNPRHRYRFILSCHTNGSGYHLRCVSLYFVLQGGPGSEGLEWPITAPVELTVRNRAGRIDKRYVINPAEEQAAREFFVGLGTPDQDNQHGWGWDGFLTEAEVRSAEWTRGDCMVIEAALRCLCCDLK